MKALEVGNLTGNRGEFHLHAATLPPRVQQMLEQKMVEIIDRRNGEAIDAEIVSQEEKQADAPPAEPLAATTTPDVDIPTDDALSRRRIVTDRGFIKSMHQFLGGE